MCLTGWPLDHYTNGRGFIFPILVHVIPSKGYSEPPLGHSFWGIFETFHNFSWPCIVVSTFLITSHTKTSVYYDIPA